MKLPAILPEGFLQALSPLERKKLGKAGVTRAEAEQIFVAGQERVLKGHAVNECLRRGAWIFEQSMRKRTSGRRGVPDIIGCHRGHFFSIELKADGHTLRPEQAYEGNNIKKAGGLFVVAYNLRDVQAALSALELL